MPLVTQSQQPLICIITGILNLHRTQISKHSMGIADNLLKSWGVLLLQDTALVKSSGLGTRKHPMIAGSEQRTSLTLLPGLSQRQQQCGM